MRYRPQPHPSSVWRPLGRQNFANILRRKQEGDRRKKSVSFVLVFAILFEFPDAQISVVHIFELNVIDVNGIYFLRD